MRGLLLACCMCLLPSEVRGIQVNVPQAERSTMLFSSVILRCDYSTSANAQNVLVTWRFKSFCKDPVLEYYSTAYQSALSLGQDPSNDCPDRLRTVRVVMQKTGSNEAILGAEYRERKISIQNMADLVINEVMWWDNGVYFCAVDAPGDTSGDNDKEVKLIVYHWLTVLLIVLGALLLIILLGVCCCQCCPQRCCCYIRCPCCPEQCCCPEKAVMQHRMIKDAQKAMAPWMGGQHIYAPMSQHSSQKNPLLYAGSSAGHIPMNPMPLPPPQSMGYSMPPPSNYGNQTPANGQMLDYMENQMRGMDMSSPMLQPQPMHPMHPMQHNQMMGPPGLSVPFSPGPPSMLSALNDDGPAERRVITLPPIREQPAARMPPRAPLTRPPSSSASSRNGGAYRRDDGGGGGGGGRGGRRPSPTRSRAMSRSYSQDSLDGGSRGAPSRGGDLGRLRSRSRDDLYETRSRGNYSPPASHRSRRDSWSSDDEDGSRRGGAARRGGGGGGMWVDNPPSYTEYEPGSKPGKRRNERLSDKSSRSGTSVVI
ncbi:immunoglobulin-like domain-containing receptor 1a [Gadus macrocephalus]|uniref:immunoglobulin-like domain-containing receptor 1a n=1 Tax=Gadus macrocephalus TaxID=80720 RepID=UPI0028CB3B4D|nr:immunoglobulin-like domain-containing receptor 1a [Gadus macrocephalus]